MLIEGIVDNNDGTRVLIKIQNEGRGKWSQVLNICAIEFLSLTTSVSFEIIDWCLFILKAFEQSHFTLLHFIFPLFRYD